MKRILFVMTLLAFAVPAHSQQAAKFVSANTANVDSARLTPGATVYIVPNGGFEDSLSAAIAKKKVPVTVVEKESAAQFKVESTIDFKKGSTARAIFLGPANDGAATTASLRVVNEATGAVVYAYNVRKYGNANTQSTSEAFAKHLKGFIEHGDN
ncbi:MAG: hypothetical protein ACRD4S_12450 [Candidatus Acidiferrales bacterium]